MRQDMPQKYTMEQRLGRWKAVLLKILWVFRCMDMKKCAIAVLTKPIYLSIVREQKEKDEKATSSDQPGWHAGSMYGQILQGEKFGHTLKKADGTFDTPPEECKHPAYKIRTRSNVRKDPVTGEIKGKSWFTCTQCGMRWERLEISTERPNEDLKGKGKGKQDYRPPLPDPIFNENDTPFVLPDTVEEWRMNVYQVGQKKIRFGKHSAKRFWDIRLDENYGDWLINEYHTSQEGTNRCSPMLAELAVWLTHYRALEEEVRGLYEHTILPELQRRRQEEQFRQYQAAEEYRVASDLEEEEEPPEAMEEDDPDQSWEQATISSFGR